jgi:CubicO group peptidase (beta-lactamase class C family)
MKSAIRRKAVLRVVAFVGALPILLQQMQAQDKAPDGDWPAVKPAAVGLDVGALASFDADIAAGKYGLVDSLLVIRDAKQALARSYAHDYANIYGEFVRREGPLNHDLNGPYNYFNSQFHPYYQHSGMHTMQSVSKTISSITIGIAMGRNEFPADLDAPILKYFDEYRIANMDERKQRITLRNLLNMTAGLEWNEDLPYNDPKNSCDVMEAQFDWVQYVINQPMAAEPGKSFVYSSGVTQLLSHIFKKATGKNVDEYAAQYLFQPLGIPYHWKHTPTDLPDTEGGLYISSASLAKIGFLFLKNGRWQSKQVVPADWVKASVTPAMTVEDEGRHWGYGFQWWLQPWGNAPEKKFAWAARGLGGQELRIVPEYNMVVVMTGWDLLPSKQEPRHDQLERVIAAVRGGTR